MIIKYFLLLINMDVKKTGNTSKEYQKILNKPEYFFCLCLKL